MLNFDTLQKCKIFTLSYICSQDKSKARTREGQTETGDVPSIGYQVYSLIIPKSLPYVSLDNALPYPVALHGFIAKPFHSLVVSTQAKRVA